MSQSCANSGNYNPLLDKISTKVSSINATLNINKLVNDVIDALGGNQLQAAAGGMVAGIGALATRPGIAASIGALAKQVGSKFVGLIPGPGQLVAAILIVMTTIDFFRKWMENLDDRLGKAETKAEAAYEFANYLIQKQNTEIAKQDEINLKNKQIQADNLLVLKGLAKENEEQSFQIDFLAGILKKALDNIDVLNANAKVREADVKVLYQNSINADISIKNLSTSLTQSNQIIQKQSQTINQLSDQVFQITAQNNQAIEIANDSSANASKAIDIANGLSSELEDSLEYSNQLTTKVNQLVADVTSLTAEIAKLNQPDNSLAGLNNTIKAVNAKADAAIITSHGALQVTQATGLTVLQAEKDIAEFKKKLSVLTPSTGITAQQAKEIQVAQQQTLTEVNNTKIEQTVIKTQVGTLTGSLESSQANTQKSVTGLNTKVGGLESVQAQLQKTIADLTAKVQGLEMNSTQDSQILKNIANALPLIAPAVAAAVVTRVPNIPQIETAVRSGVCQTAQPGGCLGTPLNQLANGQQGLGNALNTGLNAGQTAQLAILDAKINQIIGVLGKDIMPGGLVNGFKRFLSWGMIDRICNLVTLAGTVHNCFMLSNSIGSSFFSMLDNLLAIPKLIAGSEGETTSASAVFGQEVEYFFKGLFGASEWEAIKAQWKAYSTIYQSTAQVFGQVRDGFEEYQNISEVTRNTLNELGNGLQDEGILGEDNWNYRDDNDYRPKGKFARRLDNIREGIEKVENVFQDLEEVSGSLRSITETAKETKENFSAIKKAIDDANKAASDDRKAKEEGLDLPNFSLDDLF